MPGSVLNRAQQEPVHKHYDLVVIGAGLLGLSFAYFYRRFVESRVLVIEQDGIPSEQGASFVSPAIFLTDYARPEWQRKAHWVRQRLLNLAQETGVHRPHDRVFYPVTVLHVAVADPSTELAELSSLEPAQRSAVEQMLACSPQTPVQVDEYGGYGSAEALALHYGYAAVRQGVDLMLNTRVSILPDQTLKLERLEFNRHMKRVVARTEYLQSRILVVAAGAATPSLAEQAGYLLSLKRSYLQYPRVERDSRLPLDNGRVHLPVISFQGFTFRPQGDGLLVIPPPLPADPHDYQPHEGSLMNVRVGLRREILEQFLEHSDLPVLGWDSLNLGKTLRQLRGHWELITANGEPNWYELDKGQCYALGGGTMGFSLGLATAFELAVHLAGREPLPWLTP